MEFKGTKGKWDLRSYTRGNNLYSNTYVIENGLFKEHDANALLISKAPELLYFIQSFVQSFESDYVVDGEIVDNPYEWLIQEYEKAKKLIKQATTLQND